MVGTLFRCPVEHASESAYHAFHPKASFARLWGVDQKVFLIFRASLALSDLGNESLCLFIGIILSCTLIVFSKSLTLTYATFSSSLLSFSFPSSENLYPFLFFNQF